MFDYEGNPLKQAGPSMPVVVLGLTEVPRVRATVDTTEPGKLNPNARAQVAVNPDSELIPVTRSNGVLVVQVVPQSRRDGLIAINLRDDDELVRVIETGGDDDIFMVSKGGMTIRFNEADVRAMGRTAGGVRGMKLKSDDDAVVSCDVASRKNYRNAANMHQISTRRTSCRPL